MTSKHEAQWVLRAQCDDRQALESLFRSIQPALTRYVRAIVGARHAEDVTQEVLVTIYRRIGSLLHPDLRWRRSLWRAPCSAACSCSYCTSSG